MTWSTSQLKEILKLRQQLQPSQRGGHQCEERLSPLHCTPITTYTP